MKTTRAIRRATPLSFDRTIIAVTMSIVTLTAILVLLPITTCAETDRSIPITLVSATPLPSLANRFVRLEGWTGGDGAYSIQLSPDRTLWLFGDTYIGPIISGRRVNPALVNNTAAWQSLTDANTPMRFFWKIDTERPAALLAPSEPGTWYWPGDGAMADGALFLFMKHLGPEPGKTGGFAFYWLGDRLFKVTNPQEPPTEWQFRQADIPVDPNRLHLGAACLVVGDYLYIYGLLEGMMVDSGPTAAEIRPVMLARIHKHRLAKLDLTALEYLSGQGAPPQWSPRPQDAIQIISDGAPEMTVCRVRGIEGFIAAYTPLGFGSDILIRHAPNPWGPWSRSLRVYRCPEAGGKLGVYGAKAHPELARRYGQLIITYCRNANSLEEDALHPDIYLPQAVEVRIEPKAVPLPNPEFEITI